MGGIWQNLIAGAIVLAAIGYLLSQAWRAFERKRTGGCASSCGNCPAADEPTLVPLKAPERKSPPH